MGDDYRHDEAHPEEEEFQEETLGFRGGDELLGASPSTSLRLYICPKHGKVLPHDVFWDDKDRPRCPLCGQLLSEDASND